MKVTVLSEHGYEEAALGFSLSYNSNILRSKSILPSFAFGVPGENKFLESICVWLDITAPRYFWQQFDTYRVGTTKQSASTMHTLMSRLLTKDDFEGHIPLSTINLLNRAIEVYKAPSEHLDVEKTQREAFQFVKTNLPEGYLQRRIVCTNYKVLQNMYTQRKDHRLGQWQDFFIALSEQLEHPEFMIKGWEG